VSDEKIGVRYTIKGVTILSLWDRWLFF